MIFIMYDNDNLVTLIHYKPELLLEETLNKGIFVDEIPEPVEQENRNPVLKYNPENEELYYEYIEFDPADFPKPIEDQVQEIKEVLNILLGEDE